MVCVRKRLYLSGQCADVLIPMTALHGSVTDQPIGTLTPETSNSAVYGYSVLFGIGGGCTLLIPFAIAPSLVAPEDEFGAIGCVSVAQSVGNVFYIATAANIFQNVGVERVTQLLPADMAGGVRPLLAGASGALFSALNADQKTAVTAAIIQSLDEVYFMLVSASAVCLILAPFLGVSNSDFRLASTMITDL